MRKWGLFEITNNESDSFVTVTGIQNSQGYNKIRQTLSRQYSISNYFPDIQIINANLKGSRELELKYTSYDGAELDTKSRAEVLKHIEYLWGHEVSLDELSVFEIDFWI